MIGVLSMIVLTAFRAALFAAGFIWLWGWVSLMFRVYDSPLGLRLPEWTRIPGLLLLVAGLSLALGCVTVFVAEGRGTPAPFDPPRVFVARGPYRLARNPMYVGAALALAGYAAFHRSGAMLLFTAAWVMLAHFFVVCWEEPRLRERFGASYDEYCRAVPRWLPRLGPNG